MTSNQQISKILELIDQLLITQNQAESRPLKSHIRSLLEALPGIDKDPDGGPWFVSKDGKTLQSDDFQHDVVLSINGDFHSDESRRAYAISLAKLLGQHKVNPRFVSVPIAPSREVLTNMALRYRHDFGLEADDTSPMSCGTTEAERESILRTMAQLYEEVVRHHIHKS